MSELCVVDGFIPFTVGNGVKTNCHTYYKRVTKADTPTMYPTILIVHGGPTWGHEYMLPLQDLVQNSSIGSVIFYDQIGCGKSTRVPEKKHDSSFWNLELLCKELDNLVRHLDDIIPEEAQNSRQYDILGHSTGALITALYAARQPSGLRNLVISNGLATWKTFVDSNLALLKAYPAHVRDTIIQREEFNLGQRSHCEVSEGQYQEALNEFRKDYCLRRPPPPPQGLIKAFQNWQDATDAFFGLAGGQVEMIWGGSLIYEDSVPLLPNITANTLLVTGDWDKTTPICSQPFCDLIPNLQKVVLKGTSHLPMYEDQEQYLKVISSFLSASK